MVDATDLKSDFVLLQCVVKHCFSIGYIRVRVASNGSKRGQNAYFMMSGMHAGMHATAANLTSLGMPYQTIKPD
jgi:hypothetical protein